MAGIARFDENNLSPFFHRGGTHPPIHSAARVFWVRPRRHLLKIYYSAAARGACDARWLAPVSTAVNLFLSAGIPYDISIHPVYQHRPVMLSTHRRGLGIKLGLLLEVAGTARHGTHYL